MSKCKYLTAATGLVSLALDEYGKKLEELASLTNGSIPKPKYIVECAEYYDPKVSLEDQYTNTAQLADLVWLSYYIVQDINELIFRINVARNPESAVARISQGLYGIVPDEKVRKIQKEMYAPRSNW